MLCSSCGHENPPQARFCMSCGQALRRACPACGTEAAPEARFCMACATPLEPAASPTRTPTPAPSPVLPAAPSAPPPLPTAFASGRYQVQRFLGEGGKKRVYLAHCRLALSDALLRRNPATGQPVQPAHPEPFASAQDRPVEGRAARGSTGSPRAAEIQPEARQRAIALLDQAQADYQRLGMPLYVQDCLARRELLRA